MTNRTTPGQTAADPLREIKQSVVAIGTLADPPALPSDQLFYDGSQVDFEVRGTGFRYAYTPIKFAVKSDPDPKTGSIYNWAAVWIVTCKHCIQDTPVVAIRMDTSGGTRVYTIRSAKWWMHPEEDVAVTRFGLDSDTDEIPEELVADAFHAVQARSVGQKHTATRLQMKRTGFYESTPVSMIGFPLGMMEGGRKNYPAVRAGTIAQIQGYLDGDPGHRIFLIDGSVFGGNSGGPIVVRKGTMNSEGEILSNTAMIGMVARAVHVETIRKDESSADVMENADLVHAVTMESINETIRRYYLEKRAIEKSG